jgi:hypothetical protein
MKPFSQRLVRVWLCIAILVLLVASCADHSMKPVNGAGRLEIALTSAASSGNEYRLSGGVFSITGASTKTLSTDADPDAETLTAELPVGDYSAELAAGWVLEKRDPAGTFAAVDAQLISANPVPFTVVERQTTRVVFRFSVGGEVVNIGGQLVIGIDVDDCDAGYASDGGVCVDIDECATGQAQCGANQTCNNTSGSYTCFCDAPATLCGSQCVNMASDPENCAGCGLACGAGRGCRNSTCQSWVAMDGGYYLTCGVRTDGSVGCWGDPTWGATAAPSGTFSRVSAGVGFACGVGNDQSVACWGGVSFNQYGQSTPPNDPFSIVSTGSRHACGVRTNGTVICWGDNSFGKSSAPSGMFSDVSAGDNESCGLRTDGTLACWGLNDSGATSPPAGVFTAMTGGDNHYCALRPDGTVACWGYGSNGETSPPAATFSAVSAGGYHTCGLRTDGTVACWGYNGNGESSPPTGTFAQIRAGAYHTCGQRTDGSWVCWGSNDSGESSPPLP